MSLFLYFVLSSTDMGKDKDCEKERKKKGMDEMERTHMVMKAKKEKKRRGYKKNRKSKGTKDRKPNGYQTIN